MKQNEHGFATIEFIVAIATIVADVMLDGETTHVVAWQVLK